MRSRALKALGALLGPAHHCQITTRGVGRTGAARHASTIDNYNTNAPSTSGWSRPDADSQLPSLGRYHQLSLQLLPEAARAYANAFYARDPGHEREGGCRPLQREMAVTGSPAVLHRPCHGLLHEAVAGGRHPRLLLTGGAGVGKSMALVSLVDWARKQGWLVVYVPSAVALVRGGFFSARKGGGGWDTLTSAQQLLKGVLDAHGPQLQQLAASGGTGSLHDTVMGGLRADDQAAAAVDACLRLTQQLLAVSREGHTRVLFALDDYNALYGTSGYGTLASSPVRARRRALQAEELVLARGMRLLELPDAELGSAQVVAATSASCPLPAPPQLRPSQPVAELRVPPFSQDETAAALAHYHATGHASALTARQARALHALTQGNAAALRVAATGATPQLLSTA